MSREAVRVTRMELLKLKKSLEVAIRARNLLEEKRNVLAMELLDYIKKINLAQEKIDEKIRKAHNAFLEAQMVLGKIGIRSAIVSISPDRFSIEEKYRSIMGIRIPMLNLIENKIQIPYNFLSTPSKLDEVAFHMNEVIKTTIEVAEAQATIKKLAEELKRIKRRVNALDRIIIPRIRNRIKYIEERLSEMERETIFRIKRIKYLLEKRKIAEIV
ncbi:MAG: V-type ATP synthase subunit D [Candidatus Aenigmatarchaeota archaeon]